MTRPRDKLLNRQISNWCITHRITPVTDTIRSSTGYIAIDINTDAQAYIRAVDLHDAYKLAQANNSNFFNEALQMLETLKYQWDILEMCKERRLSRIVAALDYIEITLDETMPIDTRVGIFLFEFAESDLSHVVNSQGFEAAWNLNILKDVTAALSQLHRSGIAHQRVKASNILLFRSNTASHYLQTRLGDLASASKRVDYTPPTVASLEADIA